MRMKSVSIALGAAVLVAAAGTASAAPIVPDFDTFGALPQATFGGSGIPNTSVAITNVDYQGGAITLGLSAAQRFSNPVVTDDGAGTFFATAGADTLNGQPTYAMWNFNAYFSYTGTAPVARYRLRGPRAHASTSGPTACRVVEQSRLCVSESVHSALRRSAVGRPVQSGGFR